MVDSVLIHFIIPSIWHICVTHTSGTVERRIKLAAEVINRIIVAYITLLKLHCGVGYSSLFILFILGSRDSHVQLTGFGILIVIERTRTPILAALASVWIEPFNIA
jgi:hypothetical protein